MPRFTVKLFSHLKYQFDQDELILEFDGPVNSDQLQARINELCAQKRCSVPYRLAINQKFISKPTALSENDEIAVIPPVQGG